MCVHLYKCCKQAFIYWLFYFYGPTMIITQSLLPLVLIKQENGMPPSPVVHSLLLS